MSTSGRLYRIVAAAALVLLVRVGHSQEVSRGQAPPSEFAREYRGVIQKAFDSMVMPPLMQVLSSEEREKIGALVIEVIPSMDPLEIKLEPKQANSSRLVVSVGYLIIQDVLIDASVVAIVAGKEDRLVTYAIDAAKLAMQAERSGSSRSGPRRLPPRPFWEILGWSAQQHQSVRQNTRYKRLEARVRIETLAWIAAHALEKRLSESKVQARKPELRNEDLARTADLLTKARFAPAPALGASIYYFGAQQPNEEAAAAWLCNARQVLLAAIAMGERETAITDRATLDATFVRWRRTAEILDRRGECLADVKQ